MSRRREQNTASARRRREQRRAEANANAVRCQAILCRNIRCGTRLQNRFVDGQTVPFCPTCDRKARGLCIVCGSPELTSRPRRALYCALHRKLAQLESGEKYRKRNRRKLQAKERRRMQDPQVRADRIAYKRLARKIKPQQEARRNRESTARRKEAINAYHAAYRAAHRAAIAERELRRYHGLLPPRSCLSCPTILTGRAKKCTACKQRERAEAIAAITRRLEDAA